MKKTNFLIVIVCFAFAFSFEASALDNVYYQHCDGEMKIALTFDDGPHPKKTPQILQVLREYGVRATFFEIGENIKYYPQIAKMVLSEGPEIGNHTYSHPHINKINKGDICQELYDCDEAMKDILNYTSKLFRPPEGIVDDDIRAIAQDMNYSVILWSVDTKDWSGRSANDIVFEIKETVKPGDIILMHDYTGKNCHTVEALRRIIPILLEKGYTFVTVSELIKK